MLSSKGERTLCALALLVMLAVILAHAWVTEDAFITFRVVDNFIKGHGLRWNIDERVQVYTHPLWMLLHIPVEFLIGNIMVSTTLLSFLCAGIALAIFFAAFTAHALRAVLLAFATLLGSAAFLDFSASGLEAPLGWALLGLLLYYWRARASIWLLYFLAALFIMARFDNVISILPLLGWATWQARTRFSLWKLAAAWSPLGLWCLFSLFYYGFIFPNTKYSKLHTGLSDGWYWMHGAHYVLNFIRYDFFGFFMLALAIALGAFNAVSRFRGRTLTADGMLQCLLSLGIALHVIYVASIGGDFMAGRFFAPVLYMAMWAIGLQLASVEKFAFVRWLAVLAAAKFAALYALLPLERPTDIRANHGIVNERLYYLRTNSVLRLNDHSLHLNLKPTHTYARWGLLAPTDPKVNGFAVFGNIGMYGYYAADKIIILDPFALTDPLLSRLSVADKPGDVRIGHFRRAIPRSYEQARRTGNADAMHPVLRTGYEALRTVTSGDLFSLKRLKLIAMFNLGMFDSHLQQIDTLNKEGRL